MAHHEQIMATIDNTGRTQYVPNLMSKAYDLAMIGRLDAYAKKHLTESSQRIVDKSKASITYNAMLREKAVPEIVKWLKSKN